tara:strand:+ start:1180 stop:1326 length:147 start_codon:yes stop_codon:yes gene_type:complete
VIRKRVIFAIFIGMLTVLSGTLLSAAGLVYYTGFLDGNKRCDTAGLAR